MSEAWEDILMEMDSKLLKFAEDKKVSYSQCSSVNTSIVDSQIKSQLKSFYYFLTVVNYTNYDQSLAYQAIFIPVILDTKM